MTYPIYRPAEFPYLGYERRDEGTQPRVHVLGIFEYTLETPHRTCDVVLDDELIAGMEPRQALKLGIYWQKMIERNRAPIPADAEGQTIEAEA